MQIYNNALDQLSDFQSASSGVYKWLLLQGHAFSATDHFVSDLVPGTNEISVSGYARINCTTRVRTVDSGLSRIELTCDNPSFGTLTTGQAPTAIVLYKFITNDAASILVGYDSAAATADTADFNPFLITIPSGLLVTIHT